MAEKGGPVKRGARTRADGQLSGLSGEFFVAAELLKRGLQAAPTLGNAKSIDLFAFNPTTRKQFTIQVKTLRAPNYFLIGASEILESQIYVFVLLNPDSAPPTYFIVPGETLASKSGEFGRYFHDVKMPGIAVKHLRPFENNWDVFLE